MSLEVKAGDGDGVGAWAEEQLSLAVLDWAPPHPVGIRSFLTKHPQRQWLELEIWNFPHPLALMYDRVAVCQGQLETLFTV